MLAMHGSIQVKVFSELKTCFNTADQTIELNDINKLSYLEMVIKETMRLFPPLCIIARVSSGDVALGLIVFKFSCFFGQLVN